MPINSRDEYKIYDPIYPINLDKGNAIRCPKNPPCKVKSLSPIISFNDDLNVS